MKRKLLFQLSAVALAVCATFVLVACGGVNAGFSSQKALAEAQVNLNAKMNLMADYGEAPSFNDVAKFINGLQILGSLEGNVGEIYNAMIKELQKAHKAKMDGKWVLEYNDDGSAKTYWTGDKKLNGATGPTLAEYKQGYEDAKAELKSYNFLEAKKDDAKTKTAIATAAGGLVTNVEVWTVKYEYTPYTAGVAGTKVTVDHTEDFKMIKIDGKWYSQDIVGTITSAIGSFMP